jgi:hypothetical protein
MATQQHGNYFMKGNKGKSELAPQKRIGDGSCSGVRMVT